MICDIDFFKKHQCLMKLGRIFGVQLALKHQRNMNCMHKLQAKRMYVLAGIAFSFIGGKMIKAMKNGRAHKNYIIYVKSAA